MAEADVANMHTPYAAANKGAINLSGSFKRILPSSTMLWAKWN
jgi:hypothetical protein